MMPILEQSPAPPHHHNYTHPTFYHQEQLSEPTGKMQLTLILPNGVPSVINVDANTPMMDLLVQAASLNKLNPSGYSLVVLDSNQHVIHFKANQTVGQIGSSTISLLPKETTHSTTNTKSKTQPFEITVRLQVNLPDAQKILLRVDPTLPLHEIKEQICKQKKYTHSNHYTLRLPNKLDHPLALGLSLAEYKTNELTLIYDKNLEYEYQLNTNEIQSFDRLYRIRSESQPPKESPQDVQQEQLTNQYHPSRSSTLRPSHTSLHAYWNDPNFDTQSQISTCSSSTKKRPAPRPPGYASPHRSQPQIVYIQQQQPPIHTPSPPVRLDHHQSQESLQSENNKKKRKAPVVLPKKEQLDKPEEQHEETHTIERPGLEPPPPPCPLPTDTEPAVVDQSKEEFINTPVDDFTETPTNTNEIVVNHSSQFTNVDTPPMPPNPLLEQAHIESIQLAPPPPPEKPPVLEPEKKIYQTNIELVVEPPPPPPPVQSPLPKPPRQNPPKEKKPSTIDGLLRIVTDHTKRAETHSNTEKQTNENISYFRVAKSRCGKFETDSQGFVNNSIAIFDSTNQPKSNQSTNKTMLPSHLPTYPSQLKSSSTPVQHQTKGKQAYSLLKKYEKEEEESHSPNNTDYLKMNNNKEKSPSPPVQLEVTERTTHITVTVESDRKQLIARASPLAQQQPSPPLVAPKPFGKTITEYRTIRMIGNVGEGTPSPVSVSNESNNRRSTSIESNKRSSSSSNPSHEDLMESIRRFGGSQNLGKK